MFKYESRVSIYTVEGYLWTC